MEELEFGDRNVPYCHKAHAEVVRLEKKNRPLDAMPALKVNQIKYVKNLKNKQDKAICVVMIENKKYIMKIHAFRNSHTENSGFHFPRNLPFAREAATYRFLKHHGFCEDKVIPDFFGVVYNVRQPEDWPCLDVFEEAPRPPNAIIMEYVENMETLSVNNYTETRASKIKDIAVRFNQLGVSHCDSYPRNMQFVAGKDGEHDRVLWIDFEDAELLEPNPSKQYLREWLRDDLGTVCKFLDEMANDYARASER